ncbi:unnamed protein product [Auanema sp. JU1783]|nr:unnamed protein product [Auanema sp. JU1783]
MKLLPFILLLSVAAIPIALADDDPTDPATDTTTPAAPNTATSPASVASSVTTTPAAPISATSPASVDPSATTKVAASSSATSPASVDPSATTKAASATSQPTTINILSTTAGVPTTTTLPQVNVSYADFQRTCVKNGVCTFEYTVPNNSPQYLATQQAILDADKSLFSTYSSLAAYEEAPFLAALQAPLDQLNDLSTRLQAAQDTLNQLSNLLDQTEANQDMIRGNLTVAQIRLNQLKADRSSCYYQACFVATPPPTPTRAPTTTPVPTISPCMDDEPQQACPDQCAVDNLGQPYCTKCNQGGNLDGHKFCETSVTGSRISCGLGLFVSPDYYPGNSTRLDGSSYSANSVYSWVVNQKYAQVTTDAVKLAITAPTTLTITAIGDNQQQTITTTRVLKAIFNLYTGPYLIELRTGSSVDTTSAFAFTLAAREQS